MYTPTTLRTAFFNPSTTPLTSPSAPITNPSASSFPFRSVTADTPASTARSAFSACAKREETSRKRDVCCYATSAAAGGEVAVGEELVRPRREVREGVRLGSGVRCAGD